MNKDNFSTYHPVINMLYFAIVIGFSMFFTHPICLAISLINALAYSFYLKGSKAVRFNALYMLPLMLGTALLNPAFSHQGITILGYLPDGNPLTLESIIYGIFAAFLLVCVISWFSCFNAVMTADKFVFLFGRIAPALSLVLSMTLRFVPRFISQIKIISNAQRCIGRDISTGGLLKRVRHGIKILSILLTWALENAIDTADSMKSRGYGLPGRTAFSNFSFSKRDKQVLLFLVLIGIYILSGSMSDQLKFLYYPSIVGKEMSFYLVSLFIAWWGLTAMPIFINVREDLKWKALKAQPLPSKT